MHHLSFDLPEQQWLRIPAEARQRWPDENLSNAELLRRCVILGVRTLRYLSPESARQFVAIYRNYEPPFDGNGAPRLTIPAQPEGDHPVKRTFDLNWRSGLFLGVDHRCEIPCLSPGAGDLFRGRAGAGSPAAYGVSYRMAYALPRPQREGEVRPLGN